MKKSLVLAMAMALGVTASAYAANPFSDVPAGHWAYDSVNKLAAAGVVEGYPDGTYGGDKLMTRYEMAQIVAKAMAKGANVDKLAAEFADELDSLGVRVAALEKKSDNVTITGAVRARYMNYENNGHVADLRTRLWVKGQVNDDWTYTALLQNNQDLTNNGGDDTINLNRAYVNGKLGGLAVQAGRWDEVTSTGNVLDSYMDGVKVSYGKDVKVFGIAAKGADDGYSLTVAPADRVYVAGLEAQVGAVNGYFNYFNASEVVTKSHVEAEKTVVDATADKKEIYNVGINFDLAKDLNLAYEYMWGNKQLDNTVSKDGYVVGLSYKGAKAAEAGSYGLRATYYNQPINCYLQSTTDAPTFDDGFKGYGVGVDVTLAKNIIASFDWYDTEAIKVNEDEQLAYTQVNFLF